MNRFVKKTPPYDWSRLWSTSAFKLALILALVASFCWGVYIEVTQQVREMPLGTLHFRNAMGFVAYTVSALLAVSFSGSVLQKGWRDAEWSRSDSQVFYGGLLLGVILLLSGLEFLFFGEWRFENPFPYAVVKSAAVAGFAVFLLVVWNQERRENR